MTTATKTRATSSRTGRKQSGAKASTTSKTTTTSSIGMTMRRTNVTPKKAQEWLDASAGVKQRTIRSARVDKLVHSIESGQWRVSHQGIAIAPDGYIIDGQHRLSAVVRSGMAVEMMVAFNADPETFDVIDTGAARSPGDMLKIEGFTNVNILAAAVRAVLTYEDVVGTTDSWQTASKLITPVDIIEWLRDEQHAEVIHSATAVANRVAQALGRYGLKSVLETVALLVSTRETEMGPAAFAEFMERLSDGVMLPSNSPILALRRWFIQETGYAKVNSTHRFSTALAVTIKAMNDYSLGVERQLSIWRHGSERMPLLLPPGVREEQLIQAERELEERDAAEAAEDAASS